MSKDRANLDTHTVLRAWRTIAGSEPSVNASLWCAMRTRGEWRTTTGRRSSGGQFSPTRWLAGTGASVQTGPMNRTRKKRIIHEQVKDRHTSHWDLDLLSREQLEALMAKQQDATDSAEDTGQDARQGLPKVPGKTPEE